MKKRSTYTILVALVFLVTTTCNTSPENPEIITEALPSELNIQTVETIGSNTFKIVNTDEVLINALNILDLVELNWQSENSIFRIVVTGPSGATDYGPYKGLVLIFNNGFEMPNRTAVFELGYSGSVNAIVRTAADRIRISANLFEVNGQSYPGDVTLDVDLTELLAAEAMSESEEGALKSHVILRVNGTSSNSSEYATDEFQNSNTITREIATDYGYIWESIEYEAQQYSTLTFNENRFRIRIYSMNGSTNSENFTELADFSGSWSAISEDILEGSYDELSNITVSWRLSDDYSSLINNQGAIFNRVKVR